MIQINGRCFIGVEMDGLEVFNITHFKKLVVNEGTGLTLPVFELTLHQSDYRLHRTLVRPNTKIKITYGASATNAIPYDFIILNYSFNKGESAKFDLVLSGVLDLSDFINIPTIKHFDKTSNAILSEISTVIPIVEYAGADQQVWIQHNISDKNFIERVLANSYISDTDVVISSLNVGKELVARSVKTQLSKSGVVVANEGKGGIRFDYIKVESDAAVWSHFFSEGRTLPVFKVKDRSTDYYTPGLESIGDSQIYNNLTTGYQYPTLLDCGNCHENYYKAWADNLSKNTQFSNNKVYVFVSNYYLANDELKVTDTIKLVVNNSSYNELADPMSGKYILSEKSTVITAKYGYNHRLSLIRDYVI